ncbi:hypothetical protein [Urechidicola croceus]|uniref:Uncharacterized protein n=1 Tax=Urechidicola croceus TaxID=1850246 RepID=A0A1D8P7W5_9FLAO|nr:hypothetical protein [Urechidicola croceus]AOW20664.1 hypothetical protein LPB138_08240 [Urechidicola croceus]
MMKYIEWLTGEEMHSQSKQWLSELSFIKIEQQFLDELIKNYTLQLVNSEKFSGNQNLISTLGNLQSEIEGLFNSVINHENELHIMVDGVYQPEEEKKYRKFHGQIINDLENYLKNYKVVKKQIFEMIKNIMRSEKPKRILKQ